MKHIYNHILDRLTAEVPDLKWIDLDKGQMKFERPPILFPAALIKPQITQSANLSPVQQLVKAQITIKLCFNYTGNTSGITPEANRADSLAYFDLVEQVYKALQSWGAADMNPMERINQYEEERPDAYKVTVITFTTGYYETVG